MIDIKDILSKTPWVGRIGRFSFLKRIILAIVAWIFFALFALYGWFFLVKFSAGETPFIPFVEITNLLTGALLFILFILAIIISFYAIKATAFRLQDLNISGWWALPIFVMSFIPKLIIIVFVIFTALAIFPGVKGTNKYGTQK